MVIVVMIESGESQARLHIAVTEHRVSETADASGWAPVFHLRTKFHPSVRCKKSYEISINLSLPVTVQNVTRDQLTNMTKRRSAADKNETPAATYLKQKTNRVSMDLNINKKNVVGYIGKSYYHGQEISRSFREHRLRLIIRWEINYWCFQI